MDDKSNTAQFCLTPRECALSAKLLGASLELVPHELL